MNFKSYIQTHSQEIEHMLQCIICLFRLDKYPVMFGSVEAGHPLYFNYVLK